MIARSVYWISIWRLSEDESLLVSLLMKLQRLSYLLVRYVHLTTSYSEKSCQALYTFIFVSRESRVFNCPRVDLMCSRLGAVPWFVPQVSASQYERMVDIGSLRLLMLTLVTEWSFGICGGIALYLFSCSVRAIGRSHYGVGSAY